MRITIDKIEKLIKKHRKTGEWGCQLFFIKEILTSMLYDEYDSEIEFYIIRINEALAL